MKKNLKLKLHETVAKPQTAVLVAVSSQKQTTAQTKEYLSELAFLAETLGIQTLRWFTQNLEKPDIRLFVGKGKLEEIKAYVMHHGVDMVIFDDDLSPSQIRNVEKELCVKIYDRSLLILDIFLKRAQTSQAKTQVELARNIYLLPRLTNLWTHLERQRGATGTRAGSGEQEIETDKRTIRTYVSFLKEKLKKIDLQNHTQRKSRENMVRVALVGYTNVGKSTIMNLLSKSEVFAENKLFATVDSTVRKVTLNLYPFLLSDTVGFIRKLPHTLVECFKSTLDEVREAEILMHVVDVSHPAFEDQIAVVNATLSEIKAVDKKVILVFNKIDQYVNPEADDLMTTKPTLEQLKSSYLNQKDMKVIFISALNKDNVEELRNTLAEAVEEVYHLIYPNYLHNKTDYVALQQEWDEQQESSMDDIVESTQF
jgi:GTP-binding protein HflX